MCTKNCEFSIYMKRFVFFGLKINLLNSIHIAQGWIINRKSKLLKDALFYFENEFPCPDKMKQKQMWKIIGILSDAKSLKSRIYN